MDIMSVFSNCDVLLMSNIHDLKLCLIRQEDSDLECTRLRCPRLDCPPAC